jgi:zinc transporter 9
MAASGSKGTIVLAIGGNAVITLGKAVAALLSGSGVMWAETVHSAVDTLNQGLLLVGHERSLRAPTRKYPYGFAIEANFWGLLAAIGILFLGGGMAIYHGLHSLIDPHVPDHIGWLLGVLGFAAAVDGWVLMKVATQLVRTRGARTWRKHFRRQSASTVTVLLEDAAAVLGCIIAALAVGLCAHLQSGMPDAIAQLAIGAMLALVGLYLIYRNWTVLIGQALPKDEVDRLRIFLADLDGIERVVNVVTRRLAPHAFTLAAEVEFSGGELAGRLIREHGPRVLTAEDDAAAAEVLGRFADQLFVQQARLVDRLEAEIVEAFPEAVYISLEPDLRLDEVDAPLASNREA